MWRWNTAQHSPFAHSDYQRHITPETTEELKIDGFRALAHIQGGAGELVSRNGNVFRGFAELAAWIAAHLKVESAVLDGEICCLDPDGRPNFRDLLFRKKQCIFIALTCCTYLLGRAPESIANRLCLTLRVWSGLIEASHHTAAN